MKGLLIFMAIIFAIVTVVLYSNSVVDVHGHEVANVQTTVFCAATAIMCVVNLVGAIVIGAVENAIAIGAVENVVQGLSARAEYAPKTTATYAPKTTTTKEDKSKEKEILSKGGWKCPQCGALNYSYVTSCGCGMTKEKARNK